MKRLLPIVSALIPLSAWAADAPAEPYTWGHHMMWGGGYGMIFGPLFMVLMIAVVIAAAVFIVRLLGGPWTGAAPPHRTALDILKERFARGEIDKNEFEERRRIMGE